MIDIQPSLGRITRPAILRLPIYYAIFGFGLSLIGIMASIISHKMTFFIAFLFFGMPLIYQYYREKYDVTDVGIQYRTFFSKGFIFWSEITSIRYADGSRIYGSPKCFFIDALDAHQTGVTKNVTLIYNLSNITAFAQMALDKISQEKIDAQSKEKLIHCAQIQR